MDSFTLRPITDPDRAWVAAFAAQHWGSDEMITHGISLRISEQQGYIAEQDGQPAGLVTYHIQSHECEVVSLDSLREGAGIGTALLEAVQRAARNAGCRRLFLITTNDNTPALRFYQRRGFRLVALRREAVTEARKRKPEIPLSGIDDIPIRDEIELEMLLP